ncbi:MAG: hypothetical protein H6810_03345 [Phycisphaeraceae bacterium]|nr:MAG: hypothetical protein H6810_03345 [Phycisphaeraceae bacterium]
MTHARADDKAGRAWSPPAAASIRWRVGAAAARAAFGVDGGPFRVELLLGRRDDGSWRGVVSLDAGGDRRVLREATPVVRWARDGARGLVHLDAPGFLHATFDAADGSVLVYARTPLIGALGLGGGRYEPEDATLDCRVDRSVA